MESLRITRHITKKNLAKNTGIHLETLNTILNNQGTVKNYFRVLKSLDGVLHSSTFRLTNDIGNDLKTIRKKANISQDKLAQIIGTTQKTISDIEQIKDKNFKVETLYKYVEACGHKVQILPKEKGADYINLLHTTKETVYLTPSRIIVAINNSFGKIDLDPCAESHPPCNTGALNSYTVDDDGLNNDWHGVSYCNPPYGVRKNKMNLWLEKGFKHHVQGDTDACIFLIPFRPQMKYFTDLIIDRQATIFVFQDKITFNDASGSAPFPLILLVWSNVEYDKDAFAGELNSWVKRF